jgi:hypothetical protein
MSHKIYINTMQCGEHLFYRDGNKMCRYSYGNGKCANIDVDAYFCLGERECSISDILEHRTQREDPKNNEWQAVPAKVWEIGTRFIKD